jgi:hypothetical protein
MACNLYSTHVASSMHRVRELDMMCHSCIYFIDLSEFIRIYWMKVSSPKSLSLDVIRSSHVMCHVTYNTFVKWHVTLGESCHSCMDIRDWIDKPRA